MSVRDHADLLSEAAERTEPWIPPVIASDLGGVDPLGLRQINFDMMDQVLPGMNNVGSHIRPYMVVTWAYHRAAVLARERGGSLGSDEARDFVDRVEILFVWSQFLIDPRAELPGRQVLASLLGADSYDFSGEDWMKRRVGRRFSTALTAPITYGPALKTLGWLDPHESLSTLLVPTPEVMPAVLTFEARLGGWLDHPALSRLGGVSVNVSDVRALGELWRWDDPTPEEQAFARDVLAGDLASRVRRGGMKRLIDVAGAQAVPAVGDLRERMCLQANGPDQEMIDAAAAWRRLQTRQLFRLALESLLHWLIVRIDEVGPMHSAQIVEALVNGLEPAATTERWLDILRPDDATPVPVMDRLGSTFAEDRLGDTPSALFAALAWTLAEAPANPESFERPDRLPLARAAAEARRLADQPPETFVAHVLESWVLTQHVYWAVGRGLADTRTRRTSLLRLKVVLDEDGWTLAPRVRPGSAPVATPDRLKTAMTLASEARLIGPDRLSDV